MKKRFYQSVTVAKAADECAGWFVLLDGKPLRTPGGYPLTAPREDIAATIAAEWEAQGEDIRPDSMPLTGVASLALDIMPQQRDAVIAELLDYLPTDLLCYRAAHPVELVRRQRVVWDPLLAWFREQYGVELAVTDGIRPLCQPEEARRTMHAVMETLDDWTLAALALAVRTAGSLVIGLALLAGRLTSDQAAAAAFVDERYQQEQWGADPELTARQAAAAEMWRALSGIFMIN